MAWMGPETEESLRRELWAGDTDESVSSALREKRFFRRGLPTLDTMHTMKPFSSILYDSIVLSSCRILPGVRKVSVS